MRSLNILDVILLLLVSSTGSVSSEGHHPGLGTAVQVFGYIPQVFGHTFHVFGYTYLKGLDIHVRL